MEVIVHFEMDDSKIYAGMHADSFTRHHLDLPADALEKGRYLASKAVSTNSIG